MTGSGHRFEGFALIVVIVAAAAAACQKLPSTAADDTAASFKVTATIQDLMKAQLEPSAETVWESVSSTITAEGTQDQQPRTPEEWLELRNHAITLIEAANLLVMPQREVVAAGGTLEDAHVQGIFSPAEIQRAIAADRQAFIANAHQLHEAGTQVLAAIEARDVEALVRSGGRLDEACESCHVKFWYPNAPVPAELAGGAE